ncbi:MAG: hypothetical protein ACP5Q4_02635, partial [Candidatus Caldatribacteriaceae bacterium]
MKWRAIAVSICLWFLVFGIAGARVEVVLVPLFVEISLAPGKSEKASFLLTNHGDQTLTFSCALSQVHQGEQGEYLPAEGSGTSPQWARTSVSSFTVSPGEQKEIPVEIAISPSFPPGSYTLGLVLTNTHANGQEVTVRARLVGMVFLIVRRSGISQSRGGKYGEIERFEVREVKGGIRFVAFL